MIIVCSTHRFRVMWSLTIFVLSQKKIRVINEGLNGVPLKSVIIKILAKKSAIIKILAKNSVFI